MSRISHPFSGRPFEFSRVIGEYSQSRPGPLLVVLAGLHGNEPSSLFAVTRVVEGLRDSDSPFQGHFCGLAGNMAALEQQRRYIDRDMNRIWAADRIEGLRNAQSTCAEENEMLQVVREIESRMRGERENFFLDCHTTSSATLPYISVPRHPRSVRLAAEFPLFTVLGAGDMLENTSDRYLIDRGFTGFAFEAGQHDALASIENHEAAIWVALQRVGCIAEVPRGSNRRWPKIWSMAHAISRLNTCIASSRKPAFECVPGSSIFNGYARATCWPGKTNHRCSRNGTGAFFSPCIKSWDKRGSSSSAR